MTEITKTLVMVGVALLVGIVAVLARPSVDADRPPELKDTVLFENFKDTEKTASLKVVEFDEKLAGIKEFEVRNKDGIFVITTKSDYPADAREHLRDAALSMIGVKVIGVASQVPGDHELYGVLAPSKEKTKLGEKGVGTLVTVKDQKGEKLASLVIGKQAEGKQSDGKSTLRFVRRENEDVVLVVEFDASKLTTKFEDWIEKNLLQFAGNDLTRLEVKDYSLDAQLTPDGIGIASDQRLEIKLAWDQSQFKWNLESLREKRGDRLSPTVLLDTEELNTQKLDELKQAFENLKIIDVRRKPAKLGADLKAGKDLQADQQVIQDLVKRGFYPVPTDDGKVEILSSKGELTISTKEAVQYVLRFGESVFDASRDATQPGRYLMIAAQVDESAIPKPKLVPEPPAPAEVPEAGKKGEEKKGPIDLEKQKKADERAQIIKDNQRKTDAYNEQLKKARLKVRDLNFRFGDWYYVISDDVYKKIHLSRPDLIKEKSSAKEEGFDIEAFRELEEGPKKKEARPPMGPGGFPGGGFPGGGFPGM